MKVKFLITFFFTVILLSACNTSAPASPTPDIYAIHTAAAKTVVAELTQTAAVTTATPKATIPAIESLSTATIIPTSDLAFETVTPSPTTTPIPSPTITVEASPTDEFCDNAAYIDDISVQDRTEMSVGQNFEKTWRIKNTGTCIWGEGYHLAFSYGEKMDGQFRALSSIISPDEEVDVVVIFAAPLSAGEYSSTWRMANASGIYFGEEIYVLIVVR